MDALLPDPDQKVKRDDRVSAFYNLSRRPETTDPWVKLMIQSKKKTFRKILPGFFYHEEHEGREEKTFRIFMPFMVTNIFNNASQEQIFGYSPAFLRKIYSNFSKIPFQASS